MNRDYIKPEQIVSLDGSQVDKVAYKTFQAVAEKGITGQDSKNAIVNRNAHKQKIDYFKKQYAVAQSSDGQRYADMMINFYTKIDTEVIPYISSVFPEYKTYVVSDRIIKAGQIKQNTLEDVLSVQSSTGDAFYDVIKKPFETPEANITSNSGAFHPQGHTTNYVRQNPSVKFFDIRTQYMQTKYELTNYFRTLQNKTVGIENIVDELAQKRQLSERTHKERMIINSILKGSDGLNSLLALSDSSSVAGLLTAISPATSIATMTTMAQVKALIKFLKTKENNGDTIIRNHLVLSGVDYKALASIKNAEGALAEFNGIVAIESEGFTISVCNLLDKNNVYVKNEGVFSTTNKLILMKKEHVFIKNIIPQDTIFIYGGQINEFVSSENAIGYSQFSETYELYNNSALVFNC
jgi:hypothetical protein